MNIFVPWRVWHLRIMQWLGIWEKPVDHTPSVSNVKVTDYASSSR